MTVTLEIAIRELNASPLADPSTHLKPGGRTEVSAEIDRWKSRGLSAHVLVVDLGDPLAELLSAWDKLALDPTHDLLLVFNTRDWVARGWGLSSDEIEHALQAARPQQRTTFAHELVNALGELATLASRHAGTTATTPNGGIPIMPVGIGVAALGGFVGLAIMRRNRLAKEGLAKLGVARASAERAYTDLILACEDLAGTKEATAIQLRATEIKRRMDAVLTALEAKPGRANDPVPLGEVLQFENEFAALRSTVLQKENT